MNPARVIFTTFVVLILLLPVGLSVISADESNNTDQITTGFDYEIYRPDWLDESTSSSYSKPSGEWWTRSALDLNRNGIFDSLEELEMGKPTVNVSLDYRDTPTDDDITFLLENGFAPAKVYPTFNAVLVQDIPVSSITELSEIPEVVMVEPMGEPLAYSDVATPAVKARESTEYSPDTAWELGYSGKGVSVAIMDTGIDDSHPSLNGKWLGGVDFTKPDIFLTPRDGSYNADDTQGHGTTCAGIATGTGAPDGTYMGTAPDARLVDIRIGSTIGYAPGELFQDFYDAALEGAQWAISHKDDSWQGAPEENAGIHILSLSWGVDVGGPSDGSDAYSRSLDQTVEAGIITIVAAGNDGPDNTGFHGMGSSSLVITIGSTDDQNTVVRDDDEIASYSSRGPRTDNNDGYPYDELKPDISSPGTNIMQVQFDRFGDASNNGYGSRGSGTSYATPNVVGIVALMLEANPDLDQKLIKEILRFTSERWGEPTQPDLDPFWNKDFGWGVADAYKAVKVAESLEDTSEIDIELQCHITNVTDNLADANAAEAEFTGLAWARAGTVETVEVRWDDETSWERIDNLEEVETGAFINWSFNLDLRGMEKGNHTLYARAVNPDGSYSLIFTKEFTVINPPPKEEPSLGIGIGAIAAVILLLIIAVIAWNYFRKKKSQQGK
jgi:serine protease AprX